jgi:HEPN domain-containing protein
VSVQKNSVRKFKIAAGQRLETAAFLFRESTHYRDAIYLAGYSVECALKAMILYRTPRRLFEAMYEKLTQGKKAHDYEFLKGILKRAPINWTIPADVSEQLLLVGVWTTNLRYEVDLIEYDEAKDFLAATLRIYQWAVRNLS